jgi:hypothetical protein
VIAAYLAVAAVPPDPFHLVPPLRLPEIEVPAVTTPAPADTSKIFLVGAASVGGVLAVAIEGRIAWYTQGTESFHWIREGYYGLGTYAGGADKSGHLFSAYISTYIMRSVYRAFDIDNDTATAMAMGFTFLLWNGFEILGDGFTQYGSSPEDSSANMLGIAIAGLSGFFPEIERVFGLRIGYIPSRDLLAHEHNFLKIINDYSGMIYYYDLKLKGVLELMGIEPSLARYLMTGVVYEVWKYSPVLDAQDKRRSLGVHLSISLPEVLRRWGGDDPGVEGIARFFDFYAVPFLSVALMEDLNHNRTYLNFGISGRMELGL